MLLGSIIIFFIFSILLITSILFVFGFPVSVFQFFCGISATIIFGWLGIHLYFKQYIFKLFGILLVSVLLIMLASIYCSGKFYDIWCDGQAIHQEAIIQLANGWNPVHQQLSQQVNNSKWINPYPKALPIYAATLYKITGRIEQSKAFNFLLIAASFFLSFSALLCFKQIKPFMAFALACLFSLNPVAVYQSLSFYVDGQMSSLLCSFASLIVLLFVRSDSLIIVTLIMCIIMILNIKLTGFAYMFVFMIGIGGFLFLNKQRKLGLKILKISLISFLLGIFLVGFNPYITNMMHFGNPFYPIAGVNKLDVAHEYLPQGFRVMNRFEKLFLSLFSKSENIGGSEKVSLKWPFTVSETELITFVGADTRVGGFGPLFSGALIVTLVVILISALFDIRKTKIALGVISLLAVSIFINPEAWWVRYVPQLWMIPLVAVILSLHLLHKSLYYLGRLLVFILLINVVLILGVYIDGQMYWSKLLKQQLEFLSANSQSGELPVKFHDFSSNRIRLNEAGVKYKEVELLPCSKHISLVGFGAVPTQVCVNKK
jgi:hypothetical protein